MAMGLLEMTMRRGGKFPRTSRDGAPEEAPEPSGTALLLRLLACEQARPLIFRRRPAMAHGLQPAAGPAALRYCGNGRVAPCRLPAAIL